MNGSRGVAVYGDVLRLLFSLLISTSLALGVGATAGAQRRPAHIEEARQLFVEGLAAYERGELHVAAEKLLASQRKYRHPQTAFNIARVLERMGEPRRSIYWYSAYLEHGRPTPAERADVEERIQLLEQLYQRQQGQLFEAPPSNDELTREARVFFERGVAMFQRGHYDAAMQAFTQAHRFAPFAELLYNMAVTAERLEAWRDAIDFYREYLRLRPRAPDRAQVEEHIAELRAQRRRR